MVSVTTVYGASHKCAPRLLPGCLACASQRAQASRLSSRARAQQNTRPARRASGAQAGLAPATAPYGHGQPSAIPSTRAVLLVPGGNHESGGHRGHFRCITAAGGLTGGNTPPRLLKPRFAATPGTIMTVATSRPGDDAAKRIVMEERAWRRAARNGQERAETALEAPRLCGSAHVGLRGRIASPCCEHAAHMGVFGRLAVRRAALAAQSRVAATLL